ncbi:hypothetical protein ACVIQT_005945 [Bradyrhizobium diazoefficiens]
MIIIAMMVTDNLSETDDRVRRLAEAEILGRRRRKGHNPRCALTGRRDFKSALVALLRMTEFPSRVSVEVSRNDLYSVITWFDRAKERFDRSVFGEIEAPSYLNVRAYLEDGAVQSIAAALRQANDQDADAESASSVAIT